MKKTFLALSLVLSLTACGMTPEFLKPQVDIPAKWKAGDKVGEVAVNADWWKNFRSKELDALMEQALANNIDLRASLARIDQSRATARIAGAALLPSIDATGSLGGTQANPSFGGDSWSPAARAGLGVSYELDLFGRNRAGVKSARSTLQSTVFGHEALRLIVMGDVAKGYFRLLNLRERSGITQQNLKNIQEVLKVAQARFDAGSTSAIDVSRQKTELANAQAAVASLRNQVSIAENALAIVLGKAPQDLGLKGRGLGSINAPKIPVTQPSTVLVQRPDIRAAEMSMVAANFDIGAARAAFFPSFDIGSTAALAFSPLTSPAGTTLALLASVAAPIFSGGALEGGVQRASARQVELAESYRKTVLVSLQEVEDALSTLKAARTRQSAYADAVREAKKTYELSRGLYEAGSVDYQTMLEAERTLLNANDNYATVKFELLSAAVDLYRALGGGWKVK